ncbi:MAG: molybdopterin-binding protein [Candidatus Bathyarchaeia archaeon]
MRPFKRLISRGEALAIISANVRRVDRVERIPIEASEGRVLAEDIIADFNVPPFSRAAMDGYAVRAEDTYGASTYTPKRLRLIGRQNAGEWFEGEVGKGECLEVATGSPVPRGSDAVVPMEYIVLEGGVVEVRRPVHPGANISPEGEDIKRGETVMRLGEVLTPGKVGALAALGRGSVLVYSKPSVAVIPTGSEVRPLGSPLERGQVYDTNSYTLSALISAHGCIPKRFQVIPDEPEAIRAALRMGLSQDLIVFTGGSSVGARDLLVDAVEEVGRVLFHGVQVKPGKPTLFGIVEDKPVFGMPGYPTSCLSNAYIFLIPALRTLAGLPPYKPRMVEGRMAERVVASTGREQFLTVRVRDGLVYPAFKESGAITSMAHADGYIIIPINADVIEEGEEVMVTLLE